jgi:hypothetical protein
MEIFWNAQGGLWIISAIGTVSVGYRGQARYAAKIK